MVQLRRDNAAQRSDASVRPQCGGAAGGRLAGLLCHRRPVSAPPGGDGVARRRAGAPAGARRARRGGVSRAQAGLTARKLSRSPPDVSPRWFRALPRDLPASDRPQNLLTIHLEATADRRFATNSYLVEDEDTHDAAVIDSNLEPEQIVEVARTRRANVKAIILTHTDLDHIAGLHELREAFGSVPIAVHDAERQVVAEGKPLRPVFGPLATQPDNTG